MNYLLVGGIVLGIGAIITFIRHLYSKGRYKFIFHIHSKDLKSITTKKAKIVLDEKDKRVKKFKIESFNEPISLHDATSSINGQAVRDVTFGESGELVYLTQSQLDDSDYKQYNVEPVERSAVISLIMENQLKNPVGDKTALFAQIGWIIFIVISLVGIVFVVNKFSKMGDVLVDLSEQQKEVSANNLKIEQLRLEYQNSVTVDENGGLIRTLESNQEAATE